MKMASSKFCPHCGKNLNYTAGFMHLPAGFVIHSNHPYVIGAAQSQGKQSITYIGLDMATNQRVAIKEFFPGSMATRSGTTVIPYSGVHGENFAYGKNTFLEEAKTGTLAATAMANKMRDWESSTGPEFGWLGVAPEFRGKRLAQVVCQAVQDRFRREGFKKIYLRTDDYRLAAIKTYLALNWQPVTDSQDMLDRWKTISKKLNLPC